MSSARNTGANYSFGTSERHRPETHPKKTMYIGKDFEKALYGTISPGPQYWPSVAPVKAASAQPIFGTAKNQIPGYGGFVPGAETSDASL